IFASPLINPPDKLNAGLAVYRQGLPAGTVNDTTLAFPVHFHGRSRRAPQGRYHSFGRSRATSTRFAPDSPLEGTGFRTIGPALAKGLSAVAEGGRRTDKLDGVIKHRSSRETTMVGRGAFLTAVSFSAGPMVRIRLPPAKSLRTFGP